MDTVRLEFILFVVPFGFIILGMMKAQIARLDRKLNLMIRHMGIDIAALADQEVLALIQRNRMAEAIKMYREYTGSTRAEAKTRVEALLLQSMQQPPNRGG